MTIMSNQHFCLQCGKLIDIFEKKCRYCGENQFGENNEYYPSAKQIAQAKKLMLREQKQPKKKKHKEGLSEEEILALELYPKDEGYKMSLISRILGKK